LQYPMLYLHLHYNILYFPSLYDLAIIELVSVYALSQKTISISSPNNLHLSLINIAMSTIDIDLSDPIL